MCGRGPRRLVDWRPWDGGPSPASRPRRCGWPTRWIACWPASAPRRAPASRWCSSGGPRSWATAWRRAPARSPSTAPRSSWRATTRRSPPTCASSSPSSWPAWPSCRAIGGSAASRCGSTGGGPAGAGGDGRRGADGGARDQRDRPTPLVDCIRCELRVRPGRSSGCDTRSAGGPLRNSPVDRRARALPQGSTSYGAKDMQVLEGLEPVRKRPGMYIGSTGPSGLHHLVWEVVDNSVDEAMAGFCDRIDVTLLADGGCRVVDNGRGIPTDINPQYKLSGVEIALTKLHGGGKFGGKGYAVSGGLQGVCVSVGNAMSKKPVVEVARDGKRHAMSFVDGGKPTGKLKVVGPAPRAGRSGRRRGTTFTFSPDPEIFETVEFSARTILERLQMMAFLNKGLEIRFRDERPGHDNEPVTFKYNGGIVDFVKHVNKTKESLFSKVGYFADSDANSEVEIAFQWNTGYNTDGIHSFANGINTVEGGTHVEGFKAALTSAVNKYARAKGLLKEKDPNLTGEDIREGITA